VKKLNEKQAQQLVNLIGGIVVVDRNNTVRWFALSHKSELRIQEDVGGWFCVHTFSHKLPILIESDRPWTEQIWEGKE